MTASISDKTRIQKIQAYSRFVKHLRKDTITIFELIGMLHKLCTLISLYKVPNADDLTKMTKTDNHKIERRRTLRKFQSNHDQKTNSNQSNKNNGLALLSQMFSEN